MTLTVSTIALVLSALAVWKTISIYRVISSLTSGSDSPRFDRLMSDLLLHLATSKKNQQELEKLIERVQQEGRSHLQRIGVVRFNPFSDIGGNQSFSIALLDGLGNGFVISSLHGRDETRLFVKPVRNGKTNGYELSAEEQRAIHDAREP